MEYMYIIEGNCDLRAHLEEEGPLEPRLCQVLRVSCACSNIQQFTHLRFDPCCHLQFTHIRFDQLWRQHVHHDKHGTTGRKSTKCEAPYLVVDRVR